MFVVNPGNQAVKLQLHDGGARVPLGQVARLPRGTGRSLTYAPFDEATGIPPGDVALLFLWDGGAFEKNMPTQILGPGCPNGIDAAAKGPRAGGPGSGIGNAFRLTSERPVVAYQMHPYNGATSHYTSATLLIPTEAWGRDHFVPTPTNTDTLGGTFAIAVASENDTTVSFIPSSDLVGGAGVAGGTPGSVSRVKLNIGEFVRFSSNPPRSSSTMFMIEPGLSGSPLTADKPVGVFGGTPCFFEGVTLVPACDSAHQQVPPISALGYQYAAVGYRPRWPDESYMWQIMGAVDGTVLTYEPQQPGKAPITLKAGQVVKFRTSELEQGPQGIWKASGPSYSFVVRSQDAQHPFYLAALMTGAGEGGLLGFDDTSRLPPTPTTRTPTICVECLGDPEFVNVVPLEQYMTAYTFFTDPSYPETNLVVVRRKGANGQFADVKLECASAPVSGWKPLGDLEYAHLDLVTGDFQRVIPTCDNGRHYISSSAPFAVTIWGWGRHAPPVPGKPQEGTGATSYAYPAGSAILRLNNVEPPIVP